tara:strand:+ start:1770 stop:2015 length:246 start_codon:yes stop_codon:yes gene_type:complete
MTKHKYINQTATFVSSEQLKFLKQMDKWLSNEPWQSEVEVDIALQVRTLITKIEDKGHYYEDEADLLNLMRAEYIKSKKKK